jgi:hypothetical protein
MRERYAKRKPVIFDPRQRRIGLDLQTIQQQVDKRRKREAREKSREDAFDHQLLDQQRQVIENAELERRQRHQVAESDDQFRMQRQKPSQAREYDI